MKAFTATTENKATAIMRAAQFREQKAFYAFGMYWDGSRGNVSGAMYHLYLQPGQVIQDLPQWAEEVHGIPRNVQHLIDSFFGFLSCCEDKSLHQHWAENIYTNIKPGADLSAVPDKLALWMLETPSVLHDYADEKGTFYIGALRAAFALRLHGIDQTKELAQIHADLDKLHRARFEGERDIANHAMGAVKALSGIDRNPHGGFHYFIEHACKGIKRKEKISFGDAIYRIADKFLELVKDS